MLVKSEDRLVSECCSLVSSKRLQCRTRSIPRHFAGYNHAHETDILTLFVGLISTFTNISAIIIDNEVTSRLGNTSSRIFTNSHPQPYQIQSDLVTYCCRTQPRLKTPKQYHISIYQSILSKIIMPALPSWLLEKMNGQPKEEGGYRKYPIKCVLTAVLMLPDELSAIIKMSNTTQKITTTEKIVVKFPSKENQLETDDASNIGVKGKSSKRKLHSLID